LQVSSYAVCLSVLASHSSAQLCRCTTRFGTSEAKLRPGHLGTLEPAAWLELSVRLQMAACHAGRSELIFQGGLIAYGVSFINSSLSTWKILFLIEGLPTILLAGLIYIFLPSTPQKSRCKYHISTSYLLTPTSYYVPRSPNRDQRL
jgi:hypothetical protein